MKNKINFVHTSIESEEKYHGEIWIRENAIEWRKARGHKAYQVKLEDFKKFMEAKGKLKNPLT